VFLQKIIKIKLKRTSVEDFNVMSKVRKQKKKEIHFYKNVVRKEGKCCVVFLKCYNAESRKNMSVKFLPHM